jgi:hypothetical protein
VTPPAPHPLIGPHSPPSTRRPAQAAALDGGQVLVLTGSAGGHLSRLRMTVPLLPGAGPEAIQVSALRCAVRCGAVQCGWPGVQERLPCGGGRCYSAWAPLPPCCLRAADPHTHTYPLPWAAFVQLCSEDFRDAELLPWLEAHDGAVAGLDISPGGEERRARGAP